MIKYKRHTSSNVWRPPCVVTPTHMAAHLTSHEPQTRSCDERGNSAKLKALKWSPFPYVKKLTQIEIANIKESIKQQQPQLQMESPTQSRTASDHSCTTSYSAIDKKLQEGSVVKRRPSLSLKRKQKEHRKRNQRSSIQMLSPMKKANLSGDHEKLSPRQLGKEKISVEQTVTIDKEHASRYHELQFAEGTSWDTESLDDHHCYNDNSDALVNMGYLSPSVSTHVDCPETFMLQSPASPIQLSPIPSCRSPHLDTSFSLELRSSSPPWSSSSCSGRSHSPSSSPTSYGDVVLENLYICHQQQLQKEPATIARSFDVVLASSSGESCAVTPTDNDAISCISESPKSKLPITDNDAIISMYTSDHDTCLITPAVAPPTSSELMNSLQEYGLPDIVYQQPFCSIPTEVPPVK